MSSTYGKKTAYLFTFFHYSNHRIREQRSWQEGKSLFLHRFCQQNLNNLYFRVIISASLAISGKEETPIISQLPMAQELQMGRVKVKFKNRRF